MDPYGTVISAYDLYVWVGIHLRFGCGPRGVQEQAALAGAIPKLQIIVERQHFGLENVAESVWKMWIF